MATIDIHHPHSLGFEPARRAVETVAGKLGTKLGLDCRWKGDELHFSRSGVSGRIVPGADGVRVQADLGWMLAPMRTTIEAEVRRLLAQSLG